MAKNLFIIEAPGKIDSYGAILSPIFGNAFRVIATRGRLFDIQGEDIGINFESGELEAWKPIDSARVDYIRQQIESSEKVYICTDNDIEGEVIASHIQSLSPATKMNRLFLDSISSDQMLDGLENPGDLNESKIRSGISRRIVDRFVGLTYSRHDYTSTDKQKVLNGNVGRILSPMLKAMEREDYYPYTVVKRGDGGINYKLDVPPSEYKNIDKLLDSIAFLNLPEVEIIDEIVDKSENQVLDGYRALRAVSSTLEVSVDQAAQILQTLYEQGRISYPRTDSSDLSKESIQQYAHMAAQYGIDTFSATNFEAKFSDLKVQGAHQGIMLINPSDIHPKKSVSESHTQLEQAMIIIHQSIINAGSQKSGNKIVTYKMKDEDCDLARFTRAHGIRVRIEKPKTSRDYDSELTPYRKPRKPKKTAPKIDVYLNDPSVYLLDLMYELKLGRPSTYPTHTKSIAKKYLYESGELNRRATNSIRLAESVSSNLSDARIASEAEDYLLRDSEEAVIGKVIKAIEMLGVGQAEISQVEAKLEGKVLQTKEARGKDNVYSPSSMGY